MVSNQENSCLRVSFYKYIFTVNKVESLSGSQFKHQLNFPPHGEHQVSGQSCMLRQQTRRLYIEAVILSSNPHIVC